VRSAVNAAVLSLVIEKPSYGSEIGRRFEERYDGLLAPIRQKIYPALAKLEVDGLIEPMSLPDGPVGEGVRATARGAQAYRGWLREPISLTGDAPFQLKIRFASTRAEDTETARYLIDEYEGAVLTLARGSAARSGSFIERALDEERRVSVDAALRWVAWVRDELRQRESDSTP
jgi:DNA-binding PadR family transcriptional regulator